MFERLTIGFGSENYGSPVRLAATIAADRAARRDPEVRQRLGEAMSELLAVRFNGYRALTMLERGQIPGPEAGLAKVTMVNAAIAATDLAADVVGPEALAPDGDWSYAISFLPGLKSAGGTEQILRNTVGERVLGLPPEPRLERFAPVQRHREEQPPVVSLPHLVERAEIRVIERGGRARLPEEAGLGGCIRNRAGEKKLQRDHAAQAGVLGAVDDAHTASADRLQHPEVRDRVPG